MKKCVTKKLVAPLMATLLMLPVSPSAVAMQQSKSPVREYLDEISKAVSIDADVRLFNQDLLDTGNVVGENKDGTPIYKEEDRWVAKARDIHLKANIPLMETAEWMLKLAFRADLARIAGEGIENGKTVEEADKLEAAIEQAEIVISRIDDGNSNQGTFFRTIRFGKGQTALREFVEANKLYKDNLLYQISHKDEVVGASVEISPGVMSGAIFEIGIHGCSEDDFKVNSDETDGCSLFSAAIQDVKLGEYATFSLEYLKRNEDEKNDDGTKKLEDTTIKIYAAVESERMGKAYIQLLVLDDNRLYPEAEIAGTIGYEKEFGPGKLVVQYEYLEEASEIVGEEIGSQNQLNLSYNIPVTEKLVVSPYITHKMYDEDKTDIDDETVIGINLNFTSDPDVRLPN